MNYTIKDEIFHHHNPHGIIITKNVMSILDENLIPLTYNIIHDPPRIRDNMMRFEGIEDIRLYEKNGEIHFMGTSTSHTKSGNNLVVSGIYNYRDLKMDECLSIDSPNNCWCEKNWTPGSRQIHSSSKAERMLGIGQYDPDNNLSKADRILGRRPSGDTSKADRILGRGGATKRCGGRKRKATRKHRKRTVKRTRK